MYQSYQYDANIKNKLIKVTDATANTEGFKDGADTTEEYGYDPNGNMTRDDNKNIRSIIYNHLNLPTQIVFQRWSDSPSISYLYTATGKKVAKTVDMASRNRIVYTVDYLDGYQYESGKLLFFPTAEGYVKYTEGVSNPFDYVFNYTDHLGNIRLSYGINPETGMLTKIEENNYYPFGLKHRSYNTEARIIVKHQPIDGFETENLDKYMVQKTDVLAEEMERPPLSTDSNPEFYSGYNYKYNGKELQEELGLNMYDYGARNYDPAIGRFMTLDPASENYKSWSPYVYGADNPLRFIDIEGLGPGDRVKKAAEFIGTKYSQQPSLNCGTELRTGSSQAALEYIDCSELVCRTLAADGVTDGVKQMSTRELVNYLADEDKFIASKDEPQAGDVFLWRGNGHGHTGIIESVDDDGTIHTIEAYGTKEGTIRGEYSLDYFKGKTGWKGFFRPKEETQDGKFDKKDDSKKDNKANKDKKSSIKVTFANGKTKSTTTVDPNEVNSWGDFWRNVNRWMNW